MRKIQQPFWQIILEHKTTKLDYYLTLYKQISGKWDINVKVKAIKSVEQTWKNIFMNLI